MRLIVGLGNPDPEYQWTPHNLGFMAVDELANRGSIRVERPEGKALVGRGKIAGEEVVLAKPQTYMNLSGISVRELLGKYELDVSDLLVMWDEVQLPLGTIRIHPDGSAGSHNGAKSVIGSLGTQEFARLRLGCGRRSSGQQPQGIRSAADAEGGVGSRQRNDRRCRRRGGIDSDARDRCGDEQVQPPQAASPTNVARVFRPVSRTPNLSRQPVAALSERAGFRPRLPSP